MNQHVLYILVRRLATIPIELLYSIFVAAYREVTTHSPYRLEPIINFVFSLLLFQHGAENLDHLLINLSDQSFIVK